MAGGSGTRFWPLSRRSRPKQFLPIISDKTMLEETVNRLAPLIPASRILTIAGEEHTRLIGELTPGIPEKNRLVEPAARNTAPSLLLATAAVYSRDPDAVVAALPADHLIRDGDRFRAVLEAGAIAASTRDRILTFGVPPTFPSTGYGYIRFNRENPDPVSGEPVFEVLEFKEKPDADTALTFLRAGTYYWNSGIFLWKASTFARKLQLYAPEMFSFWEEMIPALAGGDKRALVDIFRRIPSISIDYALMEKAKGIGMCPGDFGWSDVGSWSALYDFRERDSRGNAVRGRKRILDSENCLVHNPGRLTALIGVRDLIVVNTEDALMICRRERDQEVRAMVRDLQEKDGDDLL